MWTVIDWLPDDCLRKTLSNSEQEVEIEGRHTFDPHEFTDTWRRPILRHRGLTKLVREMEKTGLGSFQDIMLSMIPAFSSKDLLPNQVILKLIPPMRQGQSWVTTARCYSNLLDTALQNQPAELLSYCVIISVMDFLYLACEPYNGVTQTPDELKLEFGDLIAKLTSPKFNPLMQKLVPMYVLQHRRERFEQIFRLHSGEDRLDGAFLDPQVNLDIDFCIDKLGASQKFRDVYNQLAVETTSPPYSAPILSLMKTRKQRISSWDVWGMYTIADARSTTLNPRSS